MTSLGWQQFEENILSIISDFRLNSQWQTQLEKFYKKKKIK